MVINVNYNEYESTIFHVKDFVYVERTVICGEM